jgi:hypothetical protein
MKKKIVQQSWVSKGGIKTAKQPEIKTTTPKQSAEKVEVSNA